MAQAGDNSALWQTSYLNLQGKLDTRLRTILIAAAKDAQTSIDALDRKSTFSAGVRSAQLRLLVAEIEPILKGLFDDAGNIITNSQKDAAISASKSMSKQDADYLAAAFSQSGHTVAAFNAGVQQSARLGIKAAISSITKSDYDLSSTVYGTRALANKWLKNQVTILVLRGESATTIARAVRSSILPNTPGGVAYAARRLGRTELNNAFHATAVDLYKDRPWIEGVDWNLSKTHTHDPTKTEVCEQYAKKKWSVDNTPAKPHPQCRCYVTPRLVSNAEFNRNLTAGKYRSWIDEAA